MSIRNASVPVGATYAPTGGTATSMVVLSQESGKISSFIGTSGVTAQTRTECVFDAKIPRPNVAAPGGYTQGRSTVTVKVPKVLANLARTVNTAKVELAFDPETTVAEVTALKTTLINLINDADFDTFWVNQAAD